MYKMEQLTSKQMWRGKENRVTIAIEGEHHTNYILCEVLLWSHHGGKVKTSKPCQCSKPNMPTDTHWD